MCPISMPSHASKSTLYLIDQNRKLAVLVSVQIVDPWSNIIAMNYQCWPLL